MNISVSSTLPVSFGPSRQHDEDARKAAQINTGTAVDEPQTDAVDKSLASNKTRKEGTSSNTGGSSEESAPPEGSEAAKREALQDPNSALFKELETLKKRDREVRAHEMAHLAAAGPHARGGPVYEFQRGPDGQRYAVGGYVKIDTSAVPGDPEATLRKADTIRRAALAPAEPSPQDRRVAAQASSMAIDARQEIAQLRLEEIKQTQSPENGVEESSDSELSSNNDSRGQLEEKIRGSGAVEQTPPVLDLVA